MTRGFVSVAGVAAAVGLGLGGSASETIVVTSGRPAVLRWAEATTITGGVGSGQANVDIYIDGHIVKWTPLGNMLGLQTSYRLDRISGRYRLLEQENTMPRTIYSIGPLP